ncbi:MAG: c-type cytochrome [Ginsengibacter sp.]
MTRFPYLIFITLIVFFTTSCNKKSGNIQRPRDPWAFRSVLDKKPRMLTLALDSECYVAYDLANCALYKVWKGGVMMEGAAYTNKKNVQPTTWGQSYFSDSLQKFKWIAEVNGKEDSSRIVSKGYVFKNNQVYLKFELILSTDTVHIEERPEFVRSENGRPGLERVFKISGSADGTTISLKSSDTALILNAKKETSLTTYFNPLPTQFPPHPEEQYDSRGKYWMEKSDCYTCHELDKKTVGPSFYQIAQHYKNEKSTTEQLVRKIKEGGAGVWGSAVMSPHPKVTDYEIAEMLEYILSLKSADNKENDLVPEESKVPEKNVQQGIEPSLEKLHPSYDITTIHPANFKPRVGGLVFLPDGRLLVTTWDSVGGVYLLDGVETGDTNKIKVKRIASGLAEPLGITVVDGKIFVLQKPELTELIDLDGDDIIDEYRTICNSWGISGDFHEFAFGLIYKKGYFYATLSLAMRLMSNEKQKPGRGQTIKIGMDGNYESINYGLRQPNGIGLGPDGEIFECENQGEWVPCNKFIHVKKGDYHGMRWGLSDSVSKIPPVAQPAIWMPEDEIANSPSQPVLMQDGPYKGQMIHGDVTHGGIKRDFLEKINSEYQGAVFRFTQGLNAGVNRLCWGPDSALYVGEIGMVGGWTWKEKQYGLQRMKYNGKLTFEMLAVRAKPHGFEIEFTDALKSDQNISAADFLVQQWWYLPTADYGGPKKDLEKLKISRLTISPDRKRVYLEIPGLEKEHVIYFRLPENIRSTSGQSLWSSETWYTLNNIPQ